MNRSCKLSCIIIIIFITLCVVIVTFLCSAQSRLLCSSSAEDGQSRPSMLRHLTTKIKATGPITVAEYMREVLTNPVTVRDVPSAGPDEDHIQSLSSV